jgi:hypothetical protein
MAIISKNHCCKVNAILYPLFEIIYCGSCGAQLMCDGVCVGCEFQLRCLAMPRLPFKTSGHLFIHG